MKENARDCTPTPATPIYLLKGRILDGNIRVFNPADGTLLNMIELRAGAGSQAAVVNGRMYMLTDNGQLAAFQ